MVKKIHTRTSDTRAGNPVQVRGEQQVPVVILIPMPMMAQPWPSARHDEVCRARFFGRGWGDATAEFIYRRAVTQRERPAMDFVIMQRLCVLTGVLCIKYRFLTRTWQQKNFLTGFYTVIDSVEIGTGVARQLNHTLGLKINAKMSVSATLLWLVGGKMITIGK